MEGKFGNIEPIRELVYRHLRGRILSGAFNYGERLKEVAISEELGVSRTPVREALRKLELEGFVSYSNRRGVRVTNLDAKEMKELYELREVLEGLAARLAAERENDAEVDRLGELLFEMQQVCQTETIDGVPPIHTKFNETLYSMARNKKLHDILSRYNQYTEKSQLVSMRRPGRARQIMIEHRAIVDAISQRSPEKAEQAAREHVANSRKAYFGGVDG